MRTAVLSLVLIASPLLAQDPASSADSVLRAAEAKGFSGVVRIVRNGSVILEKGYGLANREQKIPFTPASIVQIGSNTKDFTAVAILQLHERGLLNIEDKLSRFFPNAPADKRDITIAQLLIHTAGFPLGLGSDFDAVTRDQLIQKAMAFKLLFSPGSRESYSNTGYSILAAIIEQVSGKSYDEYLRDNILIPAGLTRTGFLLPGFKDADLAHGYRTNGEDAGTMLAKPHAADGPYWNLRGNGGMLSTLADMHAFYKTLFETNKLLRPETRALRFNPDQPVALAGSDLVNFFLYERLPGRGIELFIASTNAAMKAPGIRRELEGIIGLPTLGQQGDGNLARASGKPVASGASALIDEFVSTLNRGDKDAIAKFITGHFASQPDGPTAEQRAERLAGIHNDLGAITIVRKSVVDDGSTQVVVRTEREGEALLIFDMETAAPFTIRKFGMQIGG